MKFDDSVLLRIGFLLARSDENVRDPRPIVFARRIYTSIELDTKVSVDLERDGVVVELAIEKLSLPLGTKVVLLRPSQREFILAMMARNQEEMAEALLSERRPGPVLH